ASHRPTPCSCCAAIRLRSPSVSGSMKTLLPAWSMRSAAQSVAFLSNTNGGQAHDRPPDRLSPIRRSNRGCRGRGLRRPPDPQACGCCGASRSFCQCHHRGRRGASDGGGTMQRANCHSMAEAWSPWGCEPLASHLYLPVELDTLNATPVEPASDLSPSETGAAVIPLLPLASDPSG